MTEDTDDAIELTRNKILAGLGTIGAASAGAGIATNALFSDTEDLGNSELTAGSLDLSVTATVVEASEYFTSSGRGLDIVGSLGTADGAVVTGLQVRDIKPGDWAILCFEFSIEDNPGYVRIGADEFAQYENGQTETEAAVDNSSGGSLGLPFDGLGQGELQDELLVEVYDEYDAQRDDSPPRSHLSGKNDRLSGTARNVFDRLSDGAVLGGRSTPIEVGPSNSPVAQYLLLELPTSAGNEVQSDAVAFDLVFETEQSRHNPIGGTATRTVTETILSPGDETTVRVTSDTPGGTVDVFERFAPVLGTASFEGATLDGEPVAPSLVELADGGGIVLFDTAEAGELVVEYSLQVAPEASAGEFAFEPNVVDVDGRTIPVDGETSVEVVE